MACTSCSTGSKESKHLLPVAEEVATATMMVRAYLSLGALPLI